MAPLEHQPSATHTPAAEPQALPFLPPGGGVCLAAVSGPGAPLVHRTRSCRPRRHAESRADVPPVRRRGLVSPAFIPTGCRDSAPSDAGPAPAGPRPKRLPGPGLTPPQTSARARVANSPGYWRVTGTRCPPTVGAGFPPPCSGMSTGPAVRQHFFLDFFEKLFRGQVHIPIRGIFPAIMGADGSRAPGDSRSGRGAAPVPVRASGPPEANIDRITVISPSLGFHPMAPSGGKESTQRRH
jgi:hypothetical protein